MQTSLNIPCTDIAYTNQERLVLDARAATVDLFQTVPWQLFSTHTFTRPVADRRVDSEWLEYLDAVRDGHRDTTGLLWCMEQVRAEKAVHRVAPHFHCLWASNKPISQRLMYDEWTARAGTSGRPIEIEPWDGNSKAISYLLKLADDPYCDWQVSSNLEMFRSATIDLSTSQARRRYRRFLGRKAN